MQRDPIGQDTRLVRCSLDLWTVKVCAGSLQLFYRYERIFVIHFHFLTQLRLLRE